MRARREGRRRIHPQERDFQAPSITVAADIPNIGRPTDATGTLGAEVRQPPDPTEPVMDALHRFR
jgi:hypothetical protein